MSRMHVLSWAVHFYTSLGLVCALLALRALGEQRPLDVFFWLAVAFAIDASDGTMARKLEVEKRLPYFSGRKLDDIIDYLNYTFIPIYFIYQQGLLGSSWLPVLGFTLIASSYGFCSEAAKTDEGFFTGFPSYWNVVAFYFYYLKLPETLAGSILLILALMTFWPVRYLYPSKTKQARWVNIGGGILWGCLCTWMVFQPQPDPLWIWGSLLYPAWYMGYSFYLHYTLPEPASH